MQSDALLNALSNTSVDLCSLRVPDKRKEVDGLEVQAREVNRAFGQS